MQNHLDKNHPLSIPGVTVIAQRETPAANIHEFTLAQHNERTTLKALLTRLGPGGQLLFHDPAAADAADPDSPGQFAVMRGAAQYHMRRGCGTCFTDWTPVDINELLNQLVALGPSNRGRLPRDRVRLTVPQSQHPA